MDWAAYFIPYGYNRVTWKKKKTEMDWACTNLHIVEIILKKKSDVGKYFIWYKYMLQRYDNSAWYWC